MKAGVHRAGHTWLVRAVEKHIANVLARAREVEQVARTEMGSDEDENVHGKLEEEVKADLAAALAFAGGWCLACAARPFGGSRRLIDARDAVENAQYLLCGKEAGAPLDQARVDLFGIIVFGRLSSDLGRTW
jgi:hypothetical protein